MAAGLKPRLQRPVVYDAAPLAAAGADRHACPHREPGMERAEDLSAPPWRRRRRNSIWPCRIPNPADDPALIRRLRAKAADLPVNVYSRPPSLRAAPAAGLLKALKAGAMALRDGSCVADAGLLKRALRLAKILKVPVLEHSESFQLTGPGVMHDCPRARRLKAPDIPREAEIFMVLRDLMLAGATGGPLHLQHLSCLESVDLTAAAKRAGIRVTAETCPHYFTLTCDDVKSAAFKMKPPLRGSADRAALKKGLADGTIDVIASDHAPHPAAEKAKGLIKAPFGVIGLETMLGLALTELVHKGVISRLRLAELMSASPARILGLKNKGGLAPGMDADITLIDPRAAYRVGPHFYSKSANSPFIGRRLRGRAAATIVGGRFVFKDGGIIDSN